ncbi:MAG: hypothetical protein L0H36_01050 [bacterium]|nr:hypothetical protein [bacterium]
MPKWRERAKSVRKQGEIQRRDWNPQSGSVHLRMYQWWQARSSRAEDISRENFCHYWRVVMIWAPLRWAWPKLLVLLGAVAAMALITGIFVYGSTFAFIAGIVLYGLFGLDVTAYVADKFVLANRNFEIGSIIRYDQFDKVLVALIMFVAIPVIVAVSAAVLVIATIVYAIYSLHVDYDAFAIIRIIGRFINKVIATAIDSLRRAIKWLFTARFSERWCLVWIRPVLAIPVVFIILGSQYSWAVAPAAIMFGATAMALLILSLSYLADKSVERARAGAQEAIKSEYDVFFRNLFALQHPKCAKDEKHFQKWFARYRKHIMDRYDEDVYDEYIPYRYLFDRNFELADKYARVYGEPKGLFLGVDVREKLTPTEKKSKKKRQSSVVEFLAFIWSVVLVNKWKICPIVDIPERG